MSNNPNTIKNLKPQKKGTPSRNPKGRPDKLPIITDCLMKQLSEIHSQGKNEVDGTTLEIIIRSIIGNAKKGDLECAK